MKIFFGEILRTRRKKINLSIDEVSSSLKISKNLLKKIEASDINNLSTFQKKYFIKNYAKFLGINDEIDLVDLGRSENLLSKKENYENEIGERLSNNYFSKKILISLLILISFFIIFYNYEKDNNNYLEKLTSIDDKLSESLYKEFDKDSVIDDLVIDNIKLEPSKVQSISTENLSAIEVSNEVIFLNFQDEVWIEIENGQEILVSRVFKKNDQISLEVIKEDEIFITSGNLGLIRVKTNYSPEKVLGLNGEIGRKKLF